MAEERTVVHLIQTQGINVSIHFEDGELVIDEGTPEQVAALFDPWVLELMREESKK